MALADFQSAGRGRLDRSWQAPARSALLCSILLRPTLDADHLQLVIAAVALSARSTLVRLCGLRPDLKWPNDLVVGDNKLAGVLGELVATKEGVAMVVGLGINLTQRPHDLDATSVLDETGITLSARGLLDILLEELEGRYAPLHTPQGRADLHAQYEKALVTLGQRVSVERLDDIVVGEARGIDEGGRLIVDVEGLETVFSTGDVVHLRRHSGASA